MVARQEFRAKVEAARLFESGEGQIVGCQGPSTKVASSSPGHGGMDTQTNSRSSLPMLRYWKAVPTGISMEVPGNSAAVRDSWSSRRQISPCPESTCQKSLTVA